jgi:hypothetical protein
MLKDELLLLQQVMDAFMQLILKCKEYTNYCLLHSSDVKVSLLAIQNSMQKCNNNYDYLACKDEVLFLE